MTKPGGPPATADLCDRHPGVQVAAPIFRDLGGRVGFCGPAATVKAYEDNVLVRATLDTPGEGRVLVVDGGGSPRCALVGDRLGALGVENGWAGLVVHGYVRDAAALSTLPLGVKALGTHPRASEKGLHSAAADRPVSFAGITVRPGDWVYADLDGLVVSTARLH